MATNYSVPVDLTDTNSAHTFVVEMVGTGKRVLDVGCSAGHVSAVLVEAGNDVIGVEVDADDAELARRQIGTVHVLDLEHQRASDVESGPFDVVLIADVVEHLRDPLPTLRDLTSLLAPGGEIIASVPNGVHADIRLMVLEGRFEYQDSGLLDRTHLRWFTRSTLRDLLAEAGLVGVELRRVVKPTGSTKIVTNVDVHGRDLLDFIAADPDHDTFQFVVRCRRTDEAGDQPDALAPIPFDWPAPEPLSTIERSERHRSEVAALQDQIDAWERSTTARLTRPLRAIVARARQAASRRR